MTKTLAEAFKDIIGSMNEFKECWDDLSRCETRGDGIIEDLLIGQEDYFAEMKNSLESDIKAVRSYNVNAITNVPALEKELGGGDATTIKEYIGLVLEDAESVCDFYESLSKNASEIIDDEDTFHLRTYGLIPERFTRGDNFCWFQSDLEASLDVYETRKEKIDSALEAAEIMEERDERE